ncbi:hypothetical protein NUSPORA_01378 [Nucleospora cyclopteri]
MKMKILILCNVLNCAKKERFVNLKKLEIASAFSESSVFKEFLPQFYNFHEPFDLENMILHFTNIIKKCIDIKLYDVTLDVYKLNECAFKKKLCVIDNNLESLKHCYYKSSDTAIFLKKIELHFFTFFYTKIGDIVKWDEIKNNLKNRLNQDINEISKLIHSTYELKKSIKKKLDSKLPKDKDIICVINRTFEFLTDYKSEMHLKLTNNNILNAVCNKFLKGHEKESNLSKNDDNKLYFVRIKDIKNYTQNKFSELTNIFKQNINFESENLVDETKNIISNIKDILCEIAEINFLNLEIDCFIDIYCFFIYLRDNIFLIQNILDVDLFTQKKDINKYNLLILNEALMLIIEQKNLLSELINNFCISSNKNIQKDPRYKKVKDKYIIIQNYIDIEIVFDNFSNSDDFNVYYKKNYWRIIYQAAKIVSHCNINHFLCKNSLYNEFSIYKIQCVLLLKLIPLHLCKFVVIKVKYYVAFNALISIFLDKIMVLLSENKEIKIESAKKHKFLKLVVQIMQEGKQSLETIIQTLQHISCKPNMTKIMFLSIKNYICLYEIINDNNNIKTKNFLDNFCIEKFGVKATNIEEDDSKSSNSKDNDSKLCIVQSQNNQYKKLKTKWIENWETDETES